ncbi:ArsB/NhaD family transporter [Tengunoibacter tsumagoiensis]|uniref:Putative arsenical pump membrane protein YdfA n=1 Tax=Tengunoibacter tsumagoiensis TaxID=2014871 RepID=A0A402AAI9_9CHLR|nr:ArsB/NhaD family transporter [Tengunoibacter tsumagoiensis]GCE15965.1 putative arsenical pump membrane protein YdfA [Tengunoibacter tsumagoiensis]
MSSSLVHTALAGALLVVVLACILIRPRNIHVAWPAGIGACLAILFGLISFPSLQTIFHTTWDASATLIALFILSETLDSNGFFSWAALLLARSARGSGWRLYLLMLFLTTIVTALLANDGAILMLTPIFAHLLSTVYPKRKELWLPFLFATGFFADSMSTLFIPSNLTNIIIADAMHLQFIHFALWMALPTLGAFLMGSIAFGLRFHTQINTMYTTTLLASPATAIRDRQLFRIGWLVLAGLVLGYIISSFITIPISLVAGSAALVMLLLVHIRGLRSINKVLLAAPWNILIYALSMFVVITAAFQAHALSFLTEPLQQFVTSTASSLQALVAGGMLAVLSAVVNNLPATLIGVLVLQTAHTTNPFSVYALIIGVNIGPKLTPFGSLATLLWLSILAKHDIPISWGRYLRENWWVTILVFCAASAFLSLSHLILH